MITIKNTQEIERMRSSGRIMRKVLSALAANVKAGMKTSEFDVMAKEMIESQGATSSFLGYVPYAGSPPFPATICTSVNEELVHGIPGERVLIEGDVFKLDLGVNFEGYHTDSAVTVAVGKVSKDAERLIVATRDALNAGIKVVKAGATTGDIGAAVAEVLNKEKLGIVRDLVGHGIGRDVHEDPLIPNFGKAGTGVELKEGMTICIEPMAGLGDYRVVLEDDDWTYSMRDRKLAAQFEHTILVTKNGHEILT